MCARSVLKSMLRSHNSRDTPALIRAPMNFNCTIPTISRSNSLSRSRTAAAFGSLALAYLSNSARDCVSFTSMSASPSSCVGPAAGVAPLISRWRDRGRRALGGRRVDEVLRRQIDRSLRPLVGAALALAERVARLLADLRLDGRGGLLVVLGHRPALL